jgi:hypothetical protein
MGVSEGLTGAGIDLQPESRAVMGRTEAGFKGFARISWGHTKTVEGNSLDGWIRWQYQ